MKNCIEINNLSKTYTNFKLDNITLSILNGSITGLIGENGAGKTTLIKSILNAITIDNGSIKIFDNDYIEKEELIKNNIGVVLDNSFFPEILKVNDINNIMKNIYITWDNNLFNKYLEEFKIPNNQVIKTFSKGMKKKLEIAVALAHKPKLLILDEPTSGLDPVIRAEILDIFNDFVSKKDHSILLSTHITSDLENVADEIIFIDDGKIVFNSNKNDILNNYGIITINDIKTIDNEDIISYRKVKDEYMVLVNNKKNKKKKYKNIKIKDASLDDIMVLYIKGVR